MGGGAVTKVAQRLRGANLGCVSGMVVGSDARERGAPGALRGRPDCASLMAGAAGASFKSATRALRVAPCTVRPMVGGSDASLKAALRGLRGAPLYAKGMAGASVVFLREAVFALRAFMVAQISVWPMEEGSGAWCPGVPRVPVGVLIAV